MLTAGPNRRLHSRTEGTVAISQANQQSFEDLFELHRARIFRFSLASLRADFKAAPIAAGLPNPGCRAS